MTAATLLPRWLPVTLAILVPLALAACQFERVKPPDGGGCPPMTCDEAGASCGLAPDGCGNLMDCGTCAAGEVCGSSSFDNVCCEPTTCVAQGADCGEMADGCGGLLHCGECSDSDVCGGGGANVCGQGDCTPQSCEALGLTCGTISDGCGLTLDCGTCGGQEICGGAGQPYVCGLPQDDTPVDLVNNCLDFPDTPISTLNHARLELILNAGDTAPDFTLRDLDGVTHSLYDLLQDKPVLLQLGSYTCPVYQRLIPDSESLAATFGDRVHFVVVYTIEAHPLGEPMPYSGRLREAEYSLFGHAYDYEERVAHAAELELDSSQLLLIDDLAPQPMTDPVWCTYATAPNAAFLIDQTGTIVVAHDWFDPPTMLTSIEQLLGQ